MKQYLMAGVIVLSLAGVAAAQPGVGSREGAVIGRVFDSDLAAPVEYANVVLYSLPESTQVNGTVTDKNGAFRLDGVKPGRYYVEVSFIGYRDRTMKEIEVAAGTPLDLGRIGLELKPISVPGVEAVGEKPTISYQIDKKVVNVSKRPNATSGTAVDALRNVPSVKVDIEDNVTVRGSSNFKVLIDGKPTQEDPSDALKQIPSATIENIEIITNPSAKYEPDGAAGIINVVLKKQKGRGISALANANAGLKHRYGGDALLGHRQGITNGYVGANLNHYRFEHDAESERLTYGDADTLSVSSHSLGYGGPTIGGVRAGLELQPGPHDKSSVSGRFRMFSTGGLTSTQTAEHHSHGDSSRQYTVDDGWRWAGRTYFALVDHEHDFDTTEHKLLARVSIGGRSGNSSGWDVELDSSEDTTYGRSTANAGPWSFLNMELEYSLPRLAGGKPDAGYEGQLERTDGQTVDSLYNPATHKYTLDSLTYHAYNGTEAVHAAYATWSWNWQKLGVQPGLRVEYDDRVITAIDLDSTYTMNRWDYFPGLHLSYSLPADQQVTASYSRRIDRPGPWELAPFLSRWSRLTFGQGNPALKPQYTDSYEAGYELPLGANSVNAGAYYRVTHDLYQQITTKYDTSTSVLLVTPRNVGNDRSLGVELSATVSPFKWLTLNPSADLSDYRVEGTLLGQDFSHRSFTWSTSLDLDVHMPFGTQMQVSGNYSAPTVTSQGRDVGGFDTDVAVKQSLLNRALSITLRVGNLLGIASWKSVSEGDGFYSSISYRMEPRVITLAVSYNLNSFRLNPKMREGEGTEMQGGPGR
ncbi:MAG: TonB-dependent receptor [candidate division WOR-3 bacterium]|nr:TonB-dependent receptor [candidate division WOR-3 bacterium]